MALYVSQIFLTIGILGFIAVQSVCLIFLFRYAKLYLIYQLYIRRLSHLIKLPVLLDFGYVPLINDYRVVCLTVNCCI